MELMVYRRVDDYVTPGIVGMLVGLTGDTICRGYFGAIPFKVF